MGTKIQRAVLLNRPIWLAEDEIENDTRSIVELYGITVDNDTTADEINIYLSYLAACSIWQQEGNDISKDHLWISKEGIYYGTKSPKIKQYLNTSMRNLGIDWTMVETSKNLDENTEGLVGGFIISNSLYRNLKEYGRKVDVQNQSYQNHKTGSRPSRRGRYSGNRYR